MTDHTLKTPPRLLTIAGSDSSGGAGIQADLKTFAAHGAYGMSVITALTAQNTLGVQSVEGVSQEMVVGQLKCVLDDVGADAIKLGMLFSAETILSITATLKEFSSSSKTRLPPIVLDPVCVSTSGHALLPASALDSLVKDLTPLATVITPNLPEAILLASKLPSSTSSKKEEEIKTVDDMVELAKDLGSIGVRYVYLKGGHMNLQSEGGKRAVVDILWDETEQTVEKFARAFIDSKNTHGTGCTLSSAIACQLALGKSVSQAVKLAGDYVFGAIASSYAIGSGAGPVNHLYSTLARSIPLPSNASPTPFVDYLIRYNADKWQRYVFHPFPIGLADGTMKLESFLHFIQQDYHFLKQYGRTNALAAYKTENMEEMAASTVIVDAVIKETEMHVKYCETYGISREALLSIPESVTNIAYTRYVLDVSSKGDLLDNRVVTAPCLLGYGEVGKRLANATSGIDTSEQNRYWGWIKEYGGDWYQGAVATGIALLEKTIAESPVSERRLEELAKIFGIATDLEIAFWDAAIEFAKNN